MFIQIKGKKPGLQLNLDRSGIRISRPTQDGLSYWDLESQEVVLKSLGKFLPRVSVESGAKTALFRLVRDKREMCSNSFPVGDRGVGEEEIESLQSGLAELDSLLDDPAIDPNAKQLLSNFRLPDPEKLPDFYRLSAGRLIIIWGCELQSEDIIPAKDALDKLLVDSKWKVWWRRYWKRVVMASLLFVLALLAIFFITQCSDGKGGNEEENISDENQTASSNNTANLDPNDESAGSNSTGPNVNISVTEITSRSESNKTIIISNEDIPGDNSPSTSVSTSQPGTDDISGAIPGSNDIPGLDPSTNLPPTTDPSLPGPGERMRDDNLTPPSGLPGTQPPSGQENTPAFPPPSTDSNDIPGLDPSTNLPPTTDPSLPGSGEKMRDDNLTPPSGLPGTQPPSGQENTPAFPPPSTDSNDIPGLDLSTNLPPTTDPSLPGSGEKMRDDNLTPPSGLPGTQPPSGQENTPSFPPPSTDSNDIPGLDPSTNLPPTTDPSLPGSTQSSASISSQSNETTVMKSNVGSSTKVLKIASGAAVIENDLIRGTVSVIAPPGKSLTDIKWKYATSSSWEDIPESNGKETVTLIRKPESLRVAVQAILLPDQKKVWGDAILNLGIKKKAIFEISPSPDEK